MDRVRGLVVERKRRAAHAPDVLGAERGQLLHDLREVQGGTLYSVPDCGGANRRSSDRLTMDSQSQENVFRKFLPSTSPCTTEVSTDT